MIDTVNESDEGSEVCYIDVAEFNKKFLKSNENKAAPSELLIKLNSENTYEFLHLDSIEYKTQRKDSDNSNLEENDNESKLMQSMLEEEKFAFN